MNSPPLATDARSAAGPDLGAVREEVRCPLCEYDLRGLAEPRCPECGYAFTWPEVTDPARRRHPYLFEHHPERNVWSFRRTLVAGLRPGRFWRSLSPVQPSSPHRLAVYAAWVAAGIFCMGPLAIGMYVASNLQLSRAALTWQQAWDDAWQDVSALLLRRVLAYFALWVAGTFLALLVFRISMRRARIRPVHVARCLVYSFDAALWATLLVVAAALAGMAAMTLLGTQGPRPLVAGIVVSAPYVLFVVVFYRLTAAYRHYLRFDRPFLTVLASQVIAWLVIVNVVFW